MAQKAKIEIQDKDKQGNQIEIAKSVPVEKAKAYVKSSAPQAARSVFAKGKGRRPKAVGRKAPKEAKVNIPKSCFSGRRGGPQDGSGPLGGTEACQMNQG